MRIVIDLQAHQCHGSRHRGIGRYARAMTRAMLKVGSDHEFWVALSDRYPDTIGPVRRELSGLIPQSRIVVFNMPERVVATHAPSAWRSRAAEALREHFLASLRPDAVFLPSLFEGFEEDCVTSIGRQSIPVAVAVHDLIPLVWPEIYIPGGVGRECYNRKLLSLRRADLWLAVSDHSKKEACELLGLPEERVVSTSEAVEDDVFKPIAYSETEKREIKARLGIDRPFVMFTSAIEQRKNVEGLIYAFGALPAELRRQHQLVLVGSIGDDTRWHLAEHARQAGMAEGELVLTGRISDQDLIALYNLCDLFVFPSFHEGFGLPVLEAMGCGAPVIGSSVTSLPEVIGRSDLLFDPNDRAELSALMARVLGDETFKASLRTYGLERAKTFSWEISAQRAIEAFKSRLPARLPAPLPGPGGPARPKLAYVSALPPLDAPDARRAAALLPELARRYDLELVTDQPEVDAGWLTANFPVRSFEWLRENAEAVHRIVYDLDGALAGMAGLAASVPGVVLLEDLFTPDERPELDDDAFLGLMYEAYGYPGMALAAERGRAEAAGAYPMSQPALAAAAGVVALSKAVREEAETWLGEHAVGEWRVLAGLKDGARVAADELAAAVEHFALYGPVARTRRMMADISAECAVAPSEADLVDVVRCLAANSRPTGKPQLLVDVSAYFDPRTAGRSRRGALKRIAALTRTDLFGYRVEPVYLDGDGFRYARGLTARALGVSDGGLEDDPVQVFSEDLFLALSPPDAAQHPALAALQLKGVKTLCVIAGEPELLEASVLASLAPVLKRWIEQVQGRDAGASLWLTPAARKAVKQVAAAGSQAGEGALEQLERSWREGVEVAALVVGRRGPVLETLAARVSRDAELKARLVDLKFANSAAAETALFAAADAAASKAAAEQDYAFTVTGHILGTYSLAIINRAVARALEDMRPGRVRIEPVETHKVGSLELVPAPERPEMERLAARPPVSGGFNISISQHYPVLIPETAPDVSFALFAWEESHVPAPIVRQLAQGFDAVLATSRFTAKALIDSGLSIPTVSIGQPPEISDFAALGREPRGTGDPFTFLHVSSAFPRKGVDVLLAAWAKAFRRSDRVRLVIKTFPNPHNDAAEQIERLRREHPDCAEIELIGHEIDQAALVDLYRRADAVVSPSRGEGYNLPALEAMAAGVPLIVTGKGGHLDFCGPGEARHIRYRMAFSQSHVAGEKALWVEPDVDDLAAALREMIDPAEHATIAERAARARSSALAAADAARWVGRLEDMVGRLAEREPPSAPRIAWVSTWDLRCGIAEYSRYLLEQFSDAGRANTLVLADMRTSAAVRLGLKTLPAWISGSAEAGYSEWGGIVPAVMQAGSEVVVIQHQDGLFPFWAVGDVCAELTRRGVQSVVTMHNCAHLPNTIQEELDRTVRGLKQATRVLVHTLADVNYLHSLGVSDNVVLLPHGARRSAHTAEIRDLASPASRPIIGCHGFFIPGKGIDQLIRAYAELRREWPGLGLRLVNARFPDIKSDVEYDKCRKIAEELGVADDIEWHTDFLPLDEIARLLAGCDLLVMAYEPRTDSASGAVRIALASLAPVLASRISFFEELGDAVAWLEATDPGTVAKTIAALLRDKQRRREIQERAAAWLDTHDWSVVSARLEGLLGGLVEARRLETAIDDAEVPEAIAGGKASSEAAGGGERADADLASVVG